MADLIQPSFSSGEVAPATYARTDLNRYFTGLRTCRNFMVMPEGGARNRSGYRFLAETKISERASRLIQFQFSTEQTYAIEVGHLYMRFYTNGGQLLSGGSTYEIVTPYEEQYLAELNFTQSADVLTIVHPSYAPMELKRLGATNWTLTAISFMPSIAAPTGLAATPLSGGSGDTTQFRYVVTAVASGESAEESVASTPATVAAWDDKSGANLTWTGVAGADHYNVYKENNGSGRFGFIGMATGSTFIDLNITPEKNDTPPTYANPFENGNNPGVVGYYQQRLVFAASESKPQTVWMSRVGAFNNFGYSQPRKDDDAIELTIASNQVNRIRAMVPLKELLVLTSGAEVTISGDATGIKPTNIRAVFQSYIGSSSVPPAVYGNTALYVQARGQKLADLSYSYTSDGFQGQDLTVLSSHLVRGYEIKAMTLAQVPNSVLWCIRNDGVKLGFTYLPAQEVFSWHRHDTDGAFESIVSIPEGDEDAVYAIVRRSINGATKRYVERLASRELRRFGPGEYWSDRAFFVDSGLTYDGRVDGTAVLTQGSDWKYPAPIKLTSSVAVFSYVPEENAVILVLLSGGTIRIPLDTVEPGETLVMYGDDGEILHLVITEVVAPDSVMVIPQTIVPESLRDISTSRWGWAKSSYSGISHLEGKTVSILADGNVLPQVVVTDGVVNTDQVALVAHVGLPIEADLETLDITLPNNQAFIGNRKRVNEVTVFCEESRGLFAGTDADHLKEFKQRSTENYTQPTDLLTGRAEISIPGRWESAGRIFIRQSDPLPLTVLGVMLNVQAGG